MLLEFAVQGKGERLEKTKTRLLLQVGSVLLPCESQQCVRSAESDPVQSSRHLRGAWKVGYGTESVRSVVHPRSRSVVWPGDQGRRGGTGCLVPGDHLSGVLLGDDVPNLPEEDGGEILLELC